MKNLLLMLVAIILLAIFGTLGFVYSMFATKSRSKYFRGVAESLDQLGNAVCSDLFNQWMLRDKVEEKALLHGWKSGTVTRYYPFGNIDETVSSVLGKNKLRDTLTKSGKWLERLLHKFDKNHSVDAIEENP